MATYLYMVPLAVVRFLRHCYAVTRTRVWADTDTKIFDTVDTGLRSDGTCIDTRASSIDACAALRMRKI